MLRLLLATAALSALGSGSGQAGTGAPYPDSPVITGVDWDRSSYRSAGDGGDIWATASASDGNVYAAWGDGKVTCPDKVSYGVAALPAKPSAVLSAGAAGRGQRQGQDQRPRGRRHHPLRDHQPAGRRLAEQRRRRLALHQQGRRLGEAVLEVLRRRPTAGGFVHFAASGDGVSGGYVYMTAMRAGGPPKAVYLMRAPSSQLANKSAYQYYNGSSWGASPGAAHPVFADPAGTNGASILYDAGLRRYILTLAHGANCGRFGMFEAASLTGPWFTVEYEDHWLGVSGGDFLGARSRPAGCRTRAGRSGPCSAATAAAAASSTTSST